MDCKVANPWPETMLGYQCFASDDSTAEPPRERVSWFELETFALENREEYVFSNQ